MESDSQINCPPPAPGTADSLIPNITNYKKAWVFKKQKENP